MSIGARLLAALSDPTRAKVFGWAAFNTEATESTMTRCAQDLGWTLPAVAKTVARLEDVGLIVRDGDKISPNLKLLQEAAEQLDAANPIVIALADFPSLGPFFAHGLLTDVPGNPDTRWDLARFLGALLDADRSYDESEVNQILQKVYPDYASLRRLIVDLKVVTRTPYGDYRLHIE